MTDLMAAATRSSRPTWHLRGRGLADDVFDARLTSITVAQHSGMQSDQLSITLDDRPDLPGRRDLAIPTIGRTGHDVEVLLGSGTTTASLGSFRLDQVTLSGSQSGRSMTITGVPRLMISESTKTWAAMSLGDVVAAIAKQNSLTAKTSVALASHRIEHENQVRESDLAFLTRLADRYDAVVKPIAGHLLFLQNGASTTASGVALAPVDVDPAHVLSWSTTATGRTGYDAVVASWYDIDEATQQQYTAGKPHGTDVFRIRTIFRDASEAKLAATSKLRELARTTSTLTLSMLGDPLLAAQKTINVSHLRNGVNGAWVIDSVVHTMDANGYGCQVTSSRKS